MNNYFLLLSLVLILLLCNNIESYENIYQKNITPTNKPDDKQFYACREDAFINLENTLEGEKYPFKKLPNSNYNIKTNQVSLPLKGTYSAFLDVNKLRTYDHFFHAPICEDDPDDVNNQQKYTFNNNYGNQFRLIPGAYPEEDISVLYENEKNYDSHDLHNPYYLHNDAKHNGNKILYSEKLQNMFLDVKYSLPKLHEDNSIYRNVSNHNDEHNII